MTPPADLTEGYVSGPAAAIEPRRQAFVDVATARRIVLVEGVTDQIAIETLAARRRLDLTARGAVVAPMGGAHAITAFLEVIRARAEPPELLGGLCDEREAEVFRAALLVDADDELAQQGFHVCRPDLEAELIRSLTPQRFEQLIDEHGDLAALRTLQKQTPWQGRAPHEQLHRFLRSKGRRMHTYAVAMVEALADDEMPPPLDAVVRML